MLHHNNDKGLVDMYTGISASATVTTTLRLKTQIRPELVLNKAFVGQILRKLDHCHAEMINLSPKLQKKKNHTG